MVNVGFRIYRETGKKYNKDRRGTYIGWSEKNDEWLPVFSPRLQQYDSKSGKNSMIQETVLEDDGDELVEPEEGHSKVYAVPRQFKCTS